MLCAASRECPAEWVRCGAGGRCAAPAARCDGRFDCDDGTDEEDCECPAQLFRCGDGQCVDLAGRCDGVSQCADSSDERSCPETTCAALGEAALPCEGSQHSCYLPQWRCDRARDCPDGGDEEGCADFDDDEHDEGEPCGPLQFTCGGRAESGAECVPLAWRCDGSRDCSDGSDETLHCGKPAAARSPRRPRSAGPNRAPLQATRRRPTARASSSAARRARAWR